MDYEHLTEAQKHQIVEGRLRQAEADHFMQTQTLSQQQVVVGVVEKEDDNEAALEQARRAVADSETSLRRIEAQIEHLRGERDRLAPKDKG